MSNIVWAILPFVFIIAIYVLIFTRRGEFERAKVSFRSSDWITYLAVVLGITALMSALRASGIGFPNAPWLVIIPILLIVIIVVIALVRKARTGRAIVRMMGDERTEVIYAKSARNALFATYLGFLVILSVTNADTVETQWLWILLASGLFVLIASLFFYYYRES